MSRLVDRTGGWPTDEERWEKWLSAKTPADMWHQALQLRGMSTADWGAVFERLGAHPLPAWDYWVQKFFLNVNGCQLVPADPAALQRLLGRVLAHDKDAEPERVFTFLCIHVAPGDHPTVAQWQTEILPAAPQLLPVALQLTDPENPWPGSKTAVWRDNLPALIDLAREYPTDVERAAGFFLSTKGVPVRLDSSRFVTDMATLLYALPPDIGSNLLATIGGRILRSKFRDRAWIGGFFIRRHLYSDPCKAFVERVLPEVGPAWGMADLLGVRTWPGEAQHQWWQVQVETAWRERRQAVTAETGTGTHVVP